MNSLITEKVKQFIIKEANRKETWLQTCCRILYPTLSFEDLTRVIKCTKLTLYENTDNNTTYLAYPNDFVEGEYIDYIASFNINGDTLPVVRNGTIFKTRHYYD